MFYELGSFLSKQTRQELDHWMQALWVLNAIMFKVFANADPMYILSLMSGMQELCVHDMPSVIVLWKKNWLSMLLPSVLLLHQGKCQRGWHPPARNLRQWCTDRKLSPAFDCRPSELRTCIRGGLFQSQWRKWRVCVFQCVIFNAGRDVCCHSWMPRRICAQGGELCGVWDQSPPDDSNSYIASSCCCAWWVVDAVLQIGEKLSNDPEVLDRSCSVDLRHYAAW